MRGSCERRAVTPSPPPSPQTGRGSPTELWRCCASSSPERDGNDVGIGMNVVGGSGRGAARQGPFIGRPLPRFEDLRLVRGQGRYTDDVSVEGQAYAVFVRSPHAHADLVSIDVSAARRLPGVLAVLTGPHYLADGHVGIAHHPNPADANDVRISHLFADAGTQDPRPRPAADRGRPRALRRRSGGDGGGGDARGCARRRRGGRGRVPGVAGGDRRRGSARRWCADAVAGGAGQSRLRKYVRRPRRGRLRARRRPPRGGADHPQPAYVQRLHGAARGGRQP